MARFTTRVELHKASSEDYETLHEAMKKQDFTTTITNDETNERFQLPTAEYNLVADLTKEEVLTKAKIAAGSTQKLYSVLVTKSGGRTWYNLPMVKK